MTETELAWAAGFFDGEGWTTAEHNVSPTFTLGISQKDRRPLERFVAALGAETNIHDNRLHSVILSGAKGLAAIEKLWPLLSEPKKEQARAAFAKAHALRSRRYEKLNAEYDRMEEVILS